MMGKLRVICGLSLLLLAAGFAAAEAPRGAVQCAQLKWSPKVLAANPDIALACQGVYEKDDILYAKATIEVAKVVGNTLWFRTLRTDGTKGKRRTVTLASSWRVTLGGGEYRLTDLVAGQQLDIFLPEDRFALTVLGGNDSQAQAIEESVE